MPYGMSARTTRTTAKKNQKMRSAQGRAARRGGKPVKPEGKVSKARAKTREKRSQKKIATIKKSRY